MNGTAHTFGQLKLGSPAGDGRQGSASINVRWGLAKWRGQPSNYTGDIAKKLRTGILCDRNGRITVEAEKTTEVAEDGDWKECKRIMKEGNPSHGSR